jgi:DNA-binding NtrC family response regulator
MAQVLINESHPDVRRLLERMVARLGHEPVAATAPTPQQLREADVFVLEPADPVGAVLAQAARLVDPSMPLVCVSVQAPPAELEEFGVVFAAALLKPFTLERLDAAILCALSARRITEGQRHNGHAGHQDRGA